MKKVLFVCHNLTIGGIQKSLISLLNAWDGGGNQVYVMTGDLSAPLVEKLPSYVKIVKTPWQLNAFFFRTHDLSCGFRALWKKPLLFARYLIAVGRVFLKFDDKDTAKKKFWRKNHKNFGFLKEYYGQFDVAISFVGAWQMWNEFTLDCIGAKRNLCWVHGDYSKFGIRCAEETETMQRFDRFVCVSKASEQTLLECLPELNGKTTVLYNLIDDVAVHAKSTAFSVEQEQAFSIVSVARISPAKGLDLAVPAVARLVREGYDLKWRIIGDGDARAVLEKQIEQENMQEHILLLGAQDNPFPYVKQADLFLQPSRNEGRPLAVEEAKCLGCAILLTDFTSASEVITNGENGMIVPLSSDGIYEGLKYLMSHPDVLQSYREQLAGYRSDDSAPQRLTVLLQE